MKQAGPPSCAVWISRWVIVVFAISGILTAQQQKVSPAFKAFRPRTTPPLVMPSNLDAQLLEAFALVQEANAGKPLAQHELGLRYLLGKGFPADSQKAFIWISKAAEQQLPAAQFNLGILYMNGWGVAWNPFEAFRHFRAAAAREMPEALYVTGLMYSEDFVVPRNWPEAYRYIRQAADLGLEDAKKTKVEMEKRGLDRVATADIAAARRTPSDTSFSLVFLDFQSDTASTVADTTLLREALQGLSIIRELPESTPVEHDRPVMDSSAQSILFRAADAGNPEALCVIGRSYERGAGVPKDLMRAGVYYLRAWRMESYRAPGLLWKLTQTPEFSRELDARSARNDPDALYVWAGLTSTGFSRLLNEAQALELLHRAVALAHLPATVELGLCYFTGRWVSKDPQRAVNLWTSAERRGNDEAKIRLAMAEIFGYAALRDTTSALVVLRDAADKGSLLADVTLAYCFEKGIGMPENKGEAYRIYHRSMRRGSETAFRSLRRMHDELRPQIQEFRMGD